jgi:predicted RNA polymerase sigma factor
MGCRRRTGAHESSGDLILLFDQDRGKWDRLPITRGWRRRSGVTARRFARSVLQAAVRPVTPRPGPGTDGLGTHRGVVRRCRNSRVTVIETNRRYAPHGRGPDAGLAIVDGCWKMAACATTTCFPPSAVTCPQARAQREARAEIQAARRSRHRTRGKAPCSIGRQGARLRSWMFGLAREELPDVERHRVNSGSRRWVVGRGSRAASLEPVRNL